LDIPFIRRFIDPRTDTEKCYGFFVQSTNPVSQAPQVGSVLRLNQTGQTLSNTLKRNYQFDPGQYGGIAQIFTVDNVETEQYSASSNFNYKIFDSSQAENYVIYTTVTDNTSPWVQSVPSNPSDLDSTLVPFNTSQGTYLASQNRNYYAAENNLWTSLYYETNFNIVNGPTKVAPEKSDSPFVISSVIQQSELVTKSWQGLVPDPYYNYYVNGIPSPFKDNLSYMRGAVIPYQQYTIQYQVDEDDGSPNLGIIFNTVALDESATVLISNSVTVQTGQVMTSPFVENPTFGRPQIDQLEVLSVQQITQPREGVSILQLSNPVQGIVEYVRVVSLNSSTLQVIRNYYPQYAIGNLPETWAKGTTVKVCVPSGYPEPSVYDVDWAPTKVAMFRFLQLMGYSPDLVRGYLEPKYFGERLLLNTNLNLSPVGGYANLTSAWPIEFNNPSAIISNTHTWQYAGYLDYSRGLPKYQVNEISKKLSYDYLSTVSWGGRLTVSGTNELGQMICLGPIREALTAKYFSTESPLSYAADRQVYSSPEPVSFPNPVLVYSTDDISGMFDGASTSFPLTRGGYPIPSTQLSDYGVFVFVGGVAQKFEYSYVIQTSSPSGYLPIIQFTEPPPEGASCDIRIVTSDDDNQSVNVVSFTLDPLFDDLQSSFAVSPSGAGLTSSNSFVFLGGIQQYPFGPTQTSSSYLVENPDTNTTLSFIGGAPNAGTLSDIRGILPGSQYLNAGVSTVFVSLVDDIAAQFNGTTQTFVLTIDGQPLDPTKVYAQNMFVSLGGVMQIPYAQAGSPSSGLAYTVGVNSATTNMEITFAVAPLANTVCNIRVITSEEFLTCPLPPQLSNASLKIGPGIDTDDKNQITGIDPGLIQS
jgi:hypothetical protein